VTHLSAVLRRLLAAGEAREAKETLRAALLEGSPSLSTGFDDDGDESDAVESDAVENVGEKTTTSKKKEKKKKKKKKKRQVKQKKERPTFDSLMRTARALEWLLFTALEAACDDEEGEEREDKEKDAVEEQTATSCSSSPASLLLSRVASLLRHHPLAGDVVVSVARKTDDSMWPRLFAATGRPSLLASSAISPSSAASSAAKNSKSNSDSSISNLEAAAACLILVDRVEGPDTAHALALRILEAALAPAFADAAAADDDGDDDGSGGAISERAELAAELLRFVVPPEPDGSLPLPAGWQRRRRRGGGGGGGESGKASSSWWPWLLSFSSEKPKTSSPPPLPPPGAPRGGAENAPAAEAAWRHLASAAEALLSRGRLLALAALSEAVRGAGGDLAELLAAVSPSSIRGARGAGAGAGEGEGAGAGEDEAKTKHRLQSGASALRAVSEVLSAFPSLLLTQGASSSPSPSSPPRSPRRAAAPEDGGEEDEKERQRGAAKDCLSLACACDRADRALALALTLGDSQATDAVAEAHPLLFDDFLRVASSPAMRGLPPRVAAAVDGARASAEERRRSRGKG